SLRRLGRGQTALPGWRHPARTRRLQPLRRTAAYGIRRDHVHVQPGRRAAWAMRTRKILIALGLAAVVIAAIFLISGGGSSENGYVVRAIFDNGSFMVPGEQVRVAGANVGEVETVDVTQPGEIDNYEHGHPEAVEGKAVIVMNITDSGFQDFREDATCEI